MSGPGDLAALAAQLVVEAGHPGADVYGDGKALAAAAARLGPRTNRGLRLVRGADLPGVSAVLHAARCTRFLAPVAHPGAMPGWFAEYSHHAVTDDLHLARIRGGYLLHLEHAPVVLNAAADAVLQDFSGRYAPLVNYVDRDLSAVLRDARHVPGRVFVLGDEIQPLNYCHWTIDALPRLDALRRQGGGADVTVAVTPLSDPFQRETLHRCGFDDAHIVELGPMQALRADELLVTSDLPAPPHPAFKASPWALRFLRRHLGPAGAPESLRRGDGRRLYVSRGDGGRRRIVNEAELVAELRQMGVEPVTLSGRSVREQASLFATASFVVGAHGAGLANIAFAPRGAALLELFPGSYGTPAYYILAAGAGLEYRYLLSEGIGSGGSTQDDDLRVDVAQVVAACRELLR